MGQQSSSQGTEAPATKTSYYELLDIEKTATEDQIKKAYRRKALELHPDRNYGHVEEATRLFAEVQSAYEVLSDPQERAWYDSHEEAVLSGFGDGGGAHDGSIPVTTTEDIAKLYANFSGKSDFSDSAGGFFTSLRDIFARLAREEMLAEDIAETAAPDYPSFGSSEDSYEDVVKPFYDVWAGFSTRKTFAWKDIYRLSEAPDRRVRRAMEKENKRLRDEAIREFNDTIRTLVMFVRKRDPRVKVAQNLTEAQRQQAQREQTASQAARARAANTAKLEAHVEADWVKSGPLESEEEDPWSEEEPEVVEHFECVICNKVFKNEKQFEAHERSKKHVQAVKKLQREMRKEGLDLGLDETAGEAIPDEQIGQVERTQDIDAEPATDNGPNDMKDEEYESDETDVASHETPGRVQSQQSNGVESLTPESGVDSVTSDDDYAPRDEVSERLASIAELNISDAPPDHLPKDEKKVGKAKEKRARKAAKHESEPANSSTLACAQCQGHFNSKNQLFDHLKKNPSHAKPIPKTKGMAKARRK